MFTKKFKTSGKAHEASCLVSEITAKKYSHSAGEKTIIPACGVIAKTMFDPEYEAEIKKILG